MLATLQREFYSVSVTIANGAAVSDAIDMRRFSGGMIHLPAAWTAASIGFKVSTTKDGTFGNLYDKNNAIVEITTPTQSRVYPLPADVFAGFWIQLWSQTSGSDTNQGAARSLTVDLKG